MSVISLPVDVLIKIALALPYPTLRHYCKTNKLFNSVCQNPHFWRQKAQLDFSKSSFKLPETREEFHQVYLSQNCLPGANSYPNDCLEKAIEAEDEQQIEYFIEHGLEDTMLFKGLKSAAKAGNIDLVKRLYKYGKETEFPKFLLKDMISYGLGHGSQMHLISRFERELETSILPGSLAKGIIDAGAHELIPRLIEKYPTLNLNILLYYAIYGRKKSVINQLIKFKVTMDQDTLEIFGEVGGYDILQLIYENNILTSDQLKTLPFASDLTTYSELEKWLSVHPLIKLQNILLGTGTSGNLKLFQQILTHAAPEYTRINTIFQVFILATLYNKINILEYIHSIVKPDQLQPVLNEALLEYGMSPARKLESTVETLLDMGANNLDEVLESISKAGLSRMTTLIKFVERDRAPQILNRLVQANLSGPHPSSRYVISLLNLINMYCGPECFDFDSLSHIIFGINVLTNDDKQLIWHTLYEIGGGDQSGDD